jgi:hypothetical protein
MFLLCSNNFEDPMDVTTNHLKLSDEHPEGKNQANCGENPHLVF